VRGASSKELLLPRAERPVDHAIGAEDRSEVPTLEHRHRDERADGRRPSIVANPRISGPNRVEARGDLPTHRRTYDPGTEREGSIGKVVTLSNELRDS
jgi:hypothetical protein